MILVLSLSDEESLDTAARWFEKAREKYLRIQREVAQQGKTPKKSKGVERPLPIVVGTGIRKAKLI